MSFYIQEWPNKTATLMAQNGTVVWTFSNVAEAEKVCLEWSKQHTCYSRESLDAGQDLSGSSCYVG